MSLVLRWPAQLLRRLIHWHSQLHKKPDLEYLELHLTDHCNLNCRGCGHYACIAPPHYADLEQHRGDMKRLGQLFQNILCIRLMGGEPLLHPDVASFIMTTRSAFPKSQIRFVTNGILLPQAPQTFWDACLNTNTTIDLTVYPSLHDRVGELYALCNSKGVSLIQRNVDTFHAHRNLKGNSDKKTAFEICRRTYYCPFLQNGRLYNCAMPALIHYFNRRFDWNIADDKGINIHARFVSGRKIIDKLSRPMKTCKWCSYSFVSFPWAVSGQTAEEWDAAAVSAENLRRL